MSKRALTKALFRKDWFVRGSRTGTLQGAGTLDTEPVKQMPKRRKNVRKSKPSKGFGD